MFETVFIKASDIKSLRLCLIYFFCFFSEEHHLNHENMEYALQMEVWKGNITGAIQMARERGQLSDWIVSLAPLGESSRHTFHGAILALF